MSESVKGKIALLPGSYDPVTTGHMSIIERATQCFEQVVVAVMNNDSKTYRFCLEERTHMVRLACASYPGVRVVCSEGLLVDLFDQIGADVIVKGVRNERDVAYEQQQADWNLSHNPRARTLLWSADPTKVDVSSTRVRAGLEQGEDVQALLPPSVIDYLKGRGLWT